MDDPSIDNTTERGNQMTATRIQHGEHGHIYSEKNGSFRAISTSRDLGATFASLSAAIAWLDKIHA